MIRVIHPGPRVGIIFGVIAALGGAFALFGWLTQHRSGFLSDWLLLVTILGVALARIYSVRVEVRDDRISRFDGFWLAQTILFDDIDRSVPLILAEREHPLGLDIYSKRRSHDGDKLRLPLKSFRKGDVAWLLSLKSLRIQS